MLLNAGSILSEKRVLRHYNIDRPIYEEGGFKQQVAILLFTLRNYAKGTCSFTQNHCVVPIIVGNILIMLVEFIVG